MNCPFCGETDFDKPGLKTHLLYDCHEYANTEVFTRLFADKEPEEPTQQS